MFDRRTFPQATSLPTADSRAEASPGLIVTIIVIINIIVTIIPIEIDIAIANIIINCIAIVIINIFSTSTIYLDWGQVILNSVAVYLFVVV